MKLDLPNISNDYKLGERTQIKVCYTIFGKQYALFLVNTILNAAYESIQNFVVYCCDKESKKVCEKYGILYRNSYGINVLQDKIINAMNLSIENPNTVILAIDVTVGHDFHTIRGAFGREHNYKDNTIYYRTYRDEFGDTSKQMKGCVIGGLLYYYNITQKTIDKYIKCYKKLNKNPKNIHYDDPQRTLSVSKVTEESVLTFNKYRLPMKHINRDMNMKLQRSFVDFGGGYTIKYMTLHKLQYFRFCYLQTDIYNDLIGKDTNEL